MGRFEEEMESVFPTYIFNLTVFSPEGQIQAIRKSPGTDAIHLKLPSCSTPSLKSDFEQSTRNGFFWEGATGRWSLKASHFIISNQHDLRVHNSKPCLTKIQVLDLTVTLSQWAAPSH